MINQFRKLSLINIFYLLLFTAFLRIPILYELPDELSSNFLGPFAHLLIKTDFGAVLSPFANVLLSAIFVFIQALIFNKVVNNHSLLGKHSFLPGLLYIISASLFMPFMTLSPVLVCNFFLIWIIAKLLRVGKSNKALLKIFDIGLIIGAGTLIYFPFIAMLLMVFLTLLLYRSFNWREWVVGILGFLTVFFFLAVFYYWTNNFGIFYQIWKPLSNKFPMVFKIDYSDYLVLIPISIIIVLALLQLRQNFFRSFISTRKAYQLLFLMYLVAGASFYLNSEFRIWHFLLCVPPGAVILSYYFANAKKWWVYESLFIVLVLSTEYFLFV
ncbi:MAG: beta-carotene 15,15'-monooxygenase [Pedobacter sp.]|nr:beta-carotene 15,15'-monooxygenase [Pedobacter sp.]